ncbi:MAG: hypothetical protein ABJL99_14990 [Aliishimia sp.]
MASAVVKLRAAANANDADAFEDALSGCSELPASKALCQILVSTLVQDWHTRHEDVVSNIQRLKCMNAVIALELRAVDCPAYLQWDENLALARKCTWALADIGTADALDALKRLAQAESLLVRSFARKRLDRWENEMVRKSDDTSDF